MRLLSSATNAGRVSHVDPMEPLVTPRSVARLLGLIMLLGLLSWLSLDIQASTRTLDQASADWLAAADEHRLAEGRPPLAVDPELYRLARAEIEAQRSLAPEHRQFRRGEFPQRLTRAGYRGEFVVLRRVSGEVARLQPARWREARRWLSRPGPLAVGFAFDEVEEGVEVVVILAERSRLQGGLRSETERDSLLDELEGSITSARARHRLGIARRDAQLDEVARGHATWMAEKGRLAHRDGRGREAAERVHEAGFSRPSWLAENLASGGQSADEVVRGWLESRSHRHSLLSDEARRIGIGIAVDREGRLWWVLLLSS